MKNILIFLVYNFQNNWQISKYLKIEQNVYKFKTKFKKKSIKNIIFFFTIINDFAY